MHKNVIKQNSAASPVTTLLVLIWSISNKRNSPAMQGSAFAEKNSSNLSSKLKIQHYRYILSAKNLSDVPIF